MKKILIVEDDPIVANIYRSRLEKENYQVQIAADGQQGFFQICEYKPNAVLLDLMLPKISGLEVLKKIRAVKEFADLPILVFTNAYVTSMIRDANAAGATAVLNKASATPRQVMDLLVSIFEGAAPAPGAPAAPASQPSAPTPPPASTPDEKMFENELQQSFAATGRIWLTEMRKSLQEVRKCGDDAARSAHLELLCRKLGTHAANAGLAGFAYIARLASATQALVKELADRPKNLTPSVLRTTAHAIDCLDDLMQNPVAGGLIDDPPIQVLVVDDDVLSRRAVALALDKASLRAIAVDTPAQALERAGQMRFDLMFLDIQMPGMDGFSLCDKLRENVMNKTTPIVFITTTADFQARAQSTLRGATDLIAKPFMFIELTVNALTYAFRSRVEQRRKGRTATSNSVVRSNSPAEVIL